MPDVPVLFGGAANPAAPLVAEAAFRKALELSPQFWNAWDGIAYTKFYAGDPAGTSEALTKAEQGAPRD